VFHVKQSKHVDQALEILGVADSHTVLEKLSEFHDLVAEMNPHVNLISKNDTSRIVERHFFDSLWFARYLDLDAESCVLDLGSGGGFPGVLLAVLCPQVPVVLVESIRKKTVFLSKVKEVCGLSNVRVVCSRAEDLDSSMVSASTVVCRSVAKLTLLIQWAWHLLDKERGRLLTVKGPDAGKEIQAALAMKGRFSIAGIDSEPFVPFPGLVQRPDRTMVIVNKKRK